MAENSQNYRIPPAVSIGHVHLKVSDLKRSLEFYHDLLGFEITQYYGDSAVFLSAGGYHHHIGLNTWQSKDAPPAPRNSAGLFHVAVLYPEKKDLARIYRRISSSGYPLDGASDHGVSQALYLRDPDQNGVELYWDRPKSEWPVDENGRLNMTTSPLDLEELLDFLKGE